MDQGPTNSDPPDATPLSPEHHQQIVRAQQQRKKLSRATKVASFNAWSFAILAGLSVLIAVFSPWSLVAAILLAWLSFNEFRGRRQLQALCPSGPRTLGWNQVFCCLCIAGYCALKLYQALAGEGVYATAIAEHPEIAHMLEPMEGLIESMTIATYLIVLIVGVGVQGVTAWYYFTRHRVLDDYVNQTPDWVLDLQRMQATAA